MSVLEINIGFFRVLELCPLGRDQGKVPGILRWAQRCCSPLSMLPRCPLQIPSRPSKSAPRRRQSAVSDASCLPRAEGVSVDGWRLLERGLKDNPQRPQLVMPLMPLVPLLDHSRQQQQKQQQTTRSPVHRLYHVYVQSRNHHPHGNVCM